MPRDAYKPKILTNDQMLQLARHMRHYGNKNEDADRAAYRIFAVSAREDPTFHERLRETTEFLNAPKVISMDPTHAKFVTNALGFVTFWTAQPKRSDKGGFESSGRGCKAMFSLPEKWVKNAPAWGKCVQIPHGSMKIRVVLEADSSATS